MLSLPINVSHLPSFSPSLQLVGTRGVCLGLKCHLQLLNESFLKLEPYTEGPSASRKGNNLVLNKVMETHTDLNKGLYKVQLMETLRDLEAFCIYAKSCESGALCEQEVRAECLVVTLRL